MDLTQAPTAGTPQELIAKLKAAKGLQDALAPVERSEYSAQASSKLESNVTASAGNSVHQNVVCTIQNGNAFVTIASSISVTSEKTLK